MNPASKIQFESNVNVAAFAVDSVREGVEAGRFIGLRSDDPMVAALFEVLERVEWSASARALVQALPHAPDHFSLFDLQSTLSRLGIQSHTVRTVDGREDTMVTPALLLDGQKCVGLLVRDVDGALIAIDPVDRTPISRNLGFAQSILTFSKSRPSGGNWFVYDLFFRSSRAIVSLLAIKLVINLVTVLTAFSVFAIFDKVVAVKSTGTLTAIAVGMTGALAVDFLYRFSKARLLARISARLEYLISSLAFRQVVSLPLEKLIAGSVAQQVARLRPFSSMASSVAVPLLDALTDLPFAVLLSILLFLLAGPIGFFPIAIFGVFVIAFGLMMPGIRRLEEQSRTSAEAHAQITSDLVAHAATIRSTYDRSTWSVRAIRAARLKASHQRKAEVASRNLALIGSMATPLVGGGTAIAGAALAMNGALTTGGLIAAMILSWRIIAPMQGFLMLVSKWSDMFRLSAQLNRLMTMPGETDKAEVPAYPRLQGSLELNGIAYRFGPSGEWALRNITATIPAGAMVAVTGPSGAGKTTLLRMIPALIHPLAGSIRIDGFNLRQVPVDHLRSYVSYVPFNPALVHGSISQNMRLASPLISDEAVVSCLHDVGLSDVINALPNGVETRLTEDIQAILPKGFQQALAIAQALIVRPKILLLDEPARSLDPQLEKVIMSTLLKKRGEMTILMVTHRPSHVRAADMELQLQNGLLRGLRDHQREAS